MYLLCRSGFLVIWFGYILEIGLVGSSVAFSDTMALSWSRSDGAVVFVEL